jgi:hypothetical protein
MEMEFVTCQARTGEEPRLSVFENRVLKRICGPERDEIKMEWRKLHNEELNDHVLLTKYYSGDRVEKTEMGDVCSTYGGEERHIQGFDGET